MDGDPVATSVDNEVVWEGPVVHTPHVIVTLNKRSIQALLLNEPVAGCVYEREREREREVSVSILQFKQIVFRIPKCNYIYMCHIQT